MEKRPTVSDVFENKKKAGQVAFIPFVTCGYKNIKDTVPILLALEAGGADIIELGVPFSDPQADGPTIQAAHQVGVDQGITIKEVLTVVKEARTLGLKAPVILMGYLNNFLAYGLDRVAQHSKEAGADGFIIVDLPPEEAQKLIQVVLKHELCFIPLVSPVTSDERMALIAKVARGYVYCVSLTGVTGVRDSLPPNLGPFMSRVRQNIKLPLALGFGLSTRRQVDEAKQYSDAVVIGSQIIKVIEAAPNTSEGRAESVKQFCLSITS